MTGHRRRGCHPGDWNCALALPKKASGYDDAVVATWPSTCAAAIRIGATDCSGSGCRQLSRPYRRGAACLRCTISTRVLSGVTMRGPAGGATRWIASASRPRGRLGLPAGPIKRFTLKRRPLRRRLTSQGIGHSLMRLPFPSRKDDSANHGFHGRSSPRARLELRDAPGREQHLAVESLSHLVLACLVRTQNVHVAERLEVPVALRHLTEPPGSSLQRGSLCHADLHTRPRRQSRPGDRSRKTASWACGCTAAPGTGTIHAGEKSRD